MKTSNKPILVVEDDRVDFMTITRAMKEIQVSNPLVHVENGKSVV